MSLRLIIIILLTALLALNIAANCQKVTNDNDKIKILRPALDSIQANQMLDHIKRLASDDLGGRGPGTRGETLTVDYVTDQFKRSGLKPGNPNGTFFQSVPMIGYETVPEINIAIDGKSISLEFLADFVHDIPRLRPNFKVSLTDIVFVGFGIVAPEFGWDDYKQADVKNKLVIVLSGEPSRQDRTDPKKSDPSFFRGDTRTYYSTRESKYETAAKKGAAGILVITDPEKSETFSIFKTFAALEGMALASSSSIYQPSIAGLMTISAFGRLMPSALSDRDDLENSAQNGDFKPISLNAKGTISVKNKLRQFTSKNIVAKIEGSDPQLKDEYVIYSAHWDHLGTDKRLTGDQIYNGASDNGAGVAQMLEIARSFAASKLRPRRSILFIATTGEEKGMLGSRFYAQNPLYPLGKTVAAINLDAGNLFGLTKDVGSAGFGNSTMDDILARAADMQGRTFLKESIDGSGAYYFASDQIEFAKVGIPAVFPWSGFDCVGKPADFGEKKWDAYGKERYHKVSDEVMPDWDLSGAVEDARWLMIAGYLVAGDTKRPTWLLGSEFKKYRMKTLIKNGRVVTSVDDYHADIFIHGDRAHGNDSPLYGAMGFVRKSEKKSGLTRKKKP